MAHRRLQLARREDCLDPPRYGVQIDEPAGTATPAAAASRACHSTTRKIGKRAAIGDALCRRRIAVATCSSTPAAVSDAVVGRLARDELGHERADARQLADDRRPDRQVGRQARRVGLAGTVDAEQLRALAGDPHHDATAVDVDPEVAVGDAGLDRRDLGRRRRPPGQSSHELDDGGRIHRLSGC